MRFIKLLLYIVIIAAVVFAVHYRINLSPCDKPLEYSIGEFDTEFGISEEYFKLRIADSEKMWESTLGKNLFQYKEGADFSINLIYDQRQRETVLKQRVESGLADAESAFEKIDKEVSEYRRDYTARAEIYDRASEEFDQKKEEYEVQVKYWNSRGGAPKGEFEKLEQTREALNSEAELLNREGISINEMTDELNRLLRLRNEAADKYNRVAEEYNKKYGESLEFDQAQYAGDKINVYQFLNEKSLVLALAHELGHALGIDHTENPNSIMYYLANEGNSDRNSLSDEDLAALRRVCRIK